METNPPIAQNQRGDVKVQIGTTEFVLERSMENLDAIESVLKKSFITLAGEVNQGKLDMTSTQFASFVYVAQKAPKLPFTKIRALVHTHGSSSLISSLSGFINAALAGSTERDDDGGNEAAKANQ